MNLGSLVDEETASVGTKRDSRGSGGGGGGVRDALNTTTAKVFAIVALVAVGAFFVQRFLGVVESNSLIRPQARYMHAETGQMRWYRVGQDAAEGYHPVEYCFNNTCGPDGGTPVILNAYLGEEGPTTCPKCGARVVGHNPRPEEYVGVKPADWGD